MRLFLSIFLAALAVTASAQTTGDVQLGVKSSTGPLTPVWITKTAGKVIGWDGSGVLGPITVSGGAWGSITGTLSAQTDLQTALDAKLSTATAASTYQPLAARLTTLSSGFGALFAGSGILKWNGSSYELLPGVIPSTTGGTGYGFYALGDLLFGGSGAFGELEKLSGNTTTAKRFLTQTGNGTVSAAPAWSTIQAADVPTLNQNTTGTAAGLSTTLAVASGGTGITSFGTGIATFLGTPSSANLAAALTNETGTGSAVFATSPTFTDSIIVNQSGQSQTGGIRVATDPANAGTRALFIVPPSTGDRVYIGISGQTAYALNFANCSGLENFPASVAKVGNLGFTLFGAGSFNIDADYSGGGRVNVSTTTTAGSLQVNNTYTSTTSFEGLRIGWASNVASIKPVAGGGGGTVRTAQYFTTGTVFWSSGAGSPESVVTAPVGSLYTRTDGGANTTLYVKESGTGNTGWIAK